MAKAEKKRTTPDARECCPRIEGLARRAVRSCSNEDYEELKAANASLTDALDGDMGRLAARLRDSAVVLTIEERQCLADHISYKIVRRRGRPKQLRIALKRNIAKRFLEIALEAPGKKTEDVIAETHKLLGEEGLSATVLRELIDEVENEKSKTVDEWTSADGTEGFRIKRLSK